MKNKILFVHGTGVRTLGFERSLALLASKLRQHLPRYEIEGCSWGEPFGARLNAGGKSIPDHVGTGAATAANENAADARWALLADDPLLELRIVEFPTVLGTPDGPKIWISLSEMATKPEILALLRPWGLADTWAQFVDMLVKDSNWRTTINGLQTSTGEAAAAVARAVAAAFLRRIREFGDAGITGSKRDQLVAALGNHIGAGLGVMDWFLDRLTNYTVTKRSGWSDALGAPVGDILRYQARGETIRNFIGERVKQTGASVIFAHSLGGVAAVDWLAEAPREVNTLVTVGSQAPFFYEIDALTSRGYGQGLPDFFPRRWLNFFDTRDFLSYAAQGLFRGFAHDVRVDNNQPFPDSHSAYWNNDREVWPEIARYLP